MPTNINDPLNINKPAIEILMDKVNAENLSQLDSNDFLFSVPTATTLPYSDINTKVTITPKVSSGYFNSRDIFYKRLDIAQILDNNSIEVLVTTETLLSELIPQINTLYGINLTADDYDDTAIPVAVPDTEHSIVVQIKTTSYLFVGTANLILGQKSISVDDSGYSRNIFIVTDSDDAAIYENKLVVLNSEYAESSSFVPFRNATAVLKFRVDKLLTLSNKDIYLGGEFQFSAALNGNPLTAITCGSVILSPTGSIKSTASGTLFGPGVLKLYGQNRGVDKVYVVDPTALIGVNANNLYRYSNDGTRDTYGATGIAYTPTLIRLCDDGKLYTVSPEYVAPLQSDPLTSAKHIRIDRLNVDGTLDGSFSPVYIRSTGIGDVTPVMDLLPLNSAGAYLVFKPIHTVATSGFTPIVNDVPFVSGLDPIDCSFNPVFKLNQDGTYSTFFKSLLPNNDPSSIVINGSELEINDPVLSFANNKIAFLTKRVNPLTGYTHRAPMSFTNMGSVVNVAPNRLANDVRWITAEKIVPLITGKFLVYGQGYTRQPSGGWSTAGALVALYNESSQLEYIVYKPIVAGLTNPQIYNLALNETLL